MRIEKIGNATLYCGDCIEILPTIQNQIDAVVSDPPYGLRFMGSKWDYAVPTVELWQTVLNAIKPGAHLLSFAGTRTQHRMAVNIEDAGFEIRDCLAWVYGSGFPKSLDVSKAIDKMAGAEREVVGKSQWYGRVPNPRKTKDDVRNYGTDNRTDDECNVITAPATDAAKQWQGFGTGLKPAFEPITLARKPLIGTVAENVLTHGTGALNVDGCRVEIDSDDEIYKTNPHTVTKGGGIASVGLKASLYKIPLGRFPANLIHDGSDEVVALFPQQKSGEIKPHISKHDPKTTPASFNHGMGKIKDYTVPKSSGTAARFFYCAKASKQDRYDGTEDRNHHPTVKPVNLMRYLCRLITPPCGIILDPFMGSGSTGKAAMLEGFKFIGIELQPEYFDIACKRIEDAQRQSELALVV